MQFGPLTEQETLDEEQKKKKDMLQQWFLKEKEKRESGISELQSKSEGIDEKQSMANLLLSAGEGLEGIARANSQVYGGAGVSDYSGTRGAISSLSAARKKDLDSRVKDIREQPERDFKESVMNAEKESMASERDPESPESKTAQTLAKRLMPSKDFTGMSAAQLKKAIPTLEKMYQIEENNKAKVESAKALAADKQEARSIMQNVREEKLEERRSDKLEKKVTSFSSTLEKTGVPAAQAAIDQVHFHLPKEGDVPGYGRIAGALPDWLISQEGEDLRQAVQTLFNIELKDRSGAAVTDQELQRLRKEFGEGTWKTGGQLRKGIEQYEKRLKEVMRNINAGFSDEVKQEYQDRGGRAFGEENSTRKPDKKVVQRIRVNGKTYDVLEDETLVEVN